MTNKIILVGQAPGPGKAVKGSDGPLSGAGGRRLAALAGLDLAVFLDRFERVNLLPEHQGKDGRGDKFDLPAARASADLLREKWRGRKAVLLGRGVAAAFRLLPDDAAWFQPVEIPPGVEIACMPHPSGISHWWNDEANVRRARDFMLSMRVGNFELIKPRKRVGRAGQPELFTPEQVGVALEAGRGIYTWAAKCLADETGIHVTSQTIANYVSRYPFLAQVKADQKERALDIAEHNVVRALEEGDRETSRWFLRSKMASESKRGYELAVSGKVDGEVVHTHKHEVTVRLQEAARRLIDATNRAGNVVDITPPLRVRGGSG